MNRVNSRSIEIEDKSQARVLHPHRIENIGMPAVGIAHDFNNLLNIIQSYVTIMEFDLGDPTALKEHLNLIKQGVEEGAALTRQLLTVARKNSVDFELTSLNSLMRTMAKWLESTLPKTIRIELELDPTVPHIQADAGRLNQLLLNLCVNARDAIGDAGSLRLSTTIMAGNELRRPLF
jgi:two-component system, cell cycle sensor histidine kinase and response regulator CckA